MKTKIFILLFTIVLVFSSDLFPQKRDSFVVNKTKDWQQQGPDEKLLIGEWLRRNTTFTLNITEVYNDNRLDLYYFVPRSIDIFKSNWTKTGSLLQVYVEFQSDIFQGSFYKLNYNPEKDLLVGEYYDSAEGITYPVEFIRTK